MSADTQFRLYITSTFLSSRDYPKVSTMLNVQALLLILIVMQTDEKQRTEKLSKCSELAQCEQDKAGI